jgi:tetratricopeptide (TPR) repeat protein
MKAKASVLLLLLLCILGCYAGTIKPLLSKPEFQAQNKPIRTLKILAMTDASFRENEIEAFVSKCSELMETQVGILVEISERQQIKWGKEFNNVPFMFFKMAADTWDKKDKFDVAVAFAYYNVTEIDKLQLGAIDTIFYRYIIIRELDPNVLLHELFHSFLLQHSEKGAMTPVLKSYGDQWYWLTPEERKQVLQNKWRDFNVVPAIGDEKERKLGEFGLYCYIGVAYLEKKQFMQAILLFTKAIEANSEYAEVYLGRGAAYKETGQYDEAISDFDKAVELNPNIAVAYYSRGLIYSMKGRYDASISDYAKALKIDPKYIEVYFDRGAAYNKKGQYDQAISDFNKALEINPRYVEAYNNRGFAYKNKGQYDQAISDYTKALEINPRYALAYNNLAWLLATAKEPGFRNGPKALELALKACELSNWKNPYHLDTLAAAYARTGDFENAIKWQEKALESHEESKKTEAQQYLDLYREHKPWPAD